MIVCIAADVPETGPMAREPLDCTVVPASEVSWEQLQTVFGTRGDAFRCQCQWFKLARGETLAGLGADELSARLREQAACGMPGDPTSGLVALAGEEPVGWVAVEPRPAYRGLVRVGKVPWEGRSEDREDPSVWAVTCFVTRAGFRRRGVSRALLTGAVEHARARGAAAVEGYPMTTTAAVTGELFVGIEQVFLEAGFHVVTRPTRRRAVVRLDF